MIQPSHYFHSRLRGVMAKVGDPKKKNWLQSLQNVRKRPDDTLCGVKLKTRRRP